MSKIQKLVKYILNKDYRFRVNMANGLCDSMPDDAYLKRLFKIVVGYDLNLDSPQTFNEKLQWLKLHDHNPLYTTMVDKYEAKKYVGNIIGEMYIIPTLGVWEQFEDIDFSSLPNQFVLKSTHDSGGVVICRDRSLFNVEDAKDVKPRIIAEKYMENLSTSTSVQVPVLNDYKLQCFDGKFDNIFVAEGRFSERGVRYHYFDHNWNYIPYCPYDDINIHDLEKLKPSCFEEMIEIAEKLSEGLPELRVDLYEITGKVYFGELTFYSQSGFDTDITHEADCILGSKLILPNLN